MDVDMRELNTHTLDELFHSSLIVTVNNRLSHYLQQQYDAWLTKQSTKVLSGPKILPLSTWLIDQYHQSLTTRTLLKPDHEAQLWLTLVEQQDLQLLNRNKMAAEIQQAWQLCHQWQVPIKELASYSTEESQLAVNLFDKMQQTCETHHWLTEAELVGWLLNNPQDTSAIKQMTFAGFDSYPADNLALIQQLSQTLTVQHYLPTPSSSKTIRRLAADDEESEIKAMAKWAFECHQQDSNQQIVCVVADLANKRSSVERVFNQQFCQASQHLLTHQPDQFPFNISTAIDSKTNTMIETALLILQLKFSYTDYSAIAWLLNTPFIYIDDEQQLSGRNLLDITLRKRVEKTVHLNTILAKSKRCPDFYQLLKSHLDSQPTDELMPPSGWKHYYISCLKRWGWPGNQGIDSYHYQLYQHWQQCLISFGHYDFLYPELNYNQAYQLLSNILNRSLFQAKTVDKPIQILGVFESAGIQADQLWISGLTQANWPAPITPNRFIPLSLQRQYRLPKSDASAELAYTKQVTERLLQIADQVIVSHPNMVNNQPSHPSHLISKYPLIDSNTFLTDKQCDLINVESVVDNYAAEVSTDSMIKGGTGLLKRQAACPFSAFANYRLQAREIPEVTNLLSAADRGQLVHECMQVIWQQIGDQTTLLSYDDSALADLVSQAVEQCLSRFGASRPISLYPSYREIEQQRLTELCIKTLLLEKQRDHFVVVADEEPRQINLDGISLWIQVDRIDQLDDGSFCVIDYKTGMANPSSWFGDRPDDLQLPIYALTDERHVQALMFTEIRPGNIKFSGIAVNPSLYSSIKPLPEFCGHDWQQLREYWQQRITDIIGEFKSGLASVNPKKAATTCQYCHLEGLCRIYE